MAAAVSLGDRFERIYNNPYSAPAVNSVNLDFDLVRERRWARLESARTDVTEARPGDEVIIETVLAPYRGERVVRQIPVKIPTSASKGTLRILVSDGFAAGGRSGSPRSRQSHANAAHQRNERHGWNAGQPGNDRQWRIKRRRNRHPGPRLCGQRSPTPDTHRKVI
jgi:hypothetical protein